MAQGANRIRGAGGLGVAGGREISRGVGRVIDRGIDRRGIGRGVDLVIVIVTVLGGAAACADAPTTLTLVKRSDGAAQVGESSCQSGGGAAVGGQGLAGPSGAEGPSGPTGGAPAIDPAGGLRGDGITAELGLDPRRIADSADTGVFREAEGGAAANLRLSSPDASGGTIVFVPVSTPSQADPLVTLSPGPAGPLGGRFRWHARLRVSSNASSSPVASLGCRRVRADGFGGTTSTDELLGIVPSSFASNTWRELSGLCHAQPDDLSVTVILANLVGGVADLSLDFVLIRPEPWPRTGSGLRLISTAAAATTGDELCAAQGGTCVRTFHVVDIRQSTDGTCTTTGSADMNTLSDCGRTFASYACVTTCQPNSRGQCADGRNSTTGGEVLCWIP